MREVNTRRSRMLEEEQVDINENESSKTLESSQAEGEGVLQ